MAHTLWLGVASLWKCDGPAEARPRSLMVLRVEVKRRGLVVFRLLRVSLLWGLGALRVKLERTDAVEGRDLVIRRRLVWGEIAGVLMNNSHSVLQREWSKGKRRCPAALPCCALKLPCSCIIYTFISVINVHHKNSTNWSFLSCLNY